MSNIGVDRLYMLLEHGCPHPRSDGQICNGGVVATDGGYFQCVRCLTHFCRHCAGSSSSRFLHDAPHPIASGWPDCRCSSAKKPYSTPQPFNPDAICPKCMSSDISTLHCPSHVPLCSARGEKRISPDDQAWAETHEHMHRTCRRCAFPWLEKCASIDQITAAQARQDRRRALPEELRRLAVSLLPKKEV